ncbi:glycosyltransferase family 39 protein [Nocardioides sp. TRM66260-LWL]|uniref:glycosyltransferase family 39 protein n=1 Tax=Nocardioides sp. TRM66260-LWL TaxID=2874478 RepID=UPI001CC46A95|nr:glycosyltransferase family 39 protein [Nocardioides sp. TRM66260-LWL]MBZ5734441.1 glycosyltransferase family 39 protein [Nocardioides sp. TRM66260-LWL]
MTTVESPPARSGPADRPGSAPGPSPDAPRRRSRSLGVDGEHLGLVALLLATAALYLVGLGASGWGNAFYAAAAQAGSESWKAFFFGASDAAGSITVDKTPLALWPMGLSVRLFGLSSWSILVPQALEGVAAVATLHACVRRATGAAWPALLAGAVLATTPVAVLMFRFDNPDAMLVLLLIGSAYAVQRAVEASRSELDAAGRPARWIALAGALVGLAFLAKMLQAFLVLPALGLAYLLLAGVPVLRRIGHLLLGLAAMVAAGGWWVAVVELWPAASRPYIGGSQHDSILELTLGYNGLGRLNGEETGSVGGGGGTGGRWGQTGLLRLVNDEIGGQVAWLLPAALVLGAAALLLTRRHAARPRVQAALVVWLGWLLVTGLTFSLMAGIFHAYYTVALAPAIGALVGVGAWAAWEHRRSTLGALTLGTAAAFTAAWAFVLLGRVDAYGWLRWPVLLLGLALAGAIALAGLLPRRAALAVGVATILVGLAAPTAYAISTAATPHTGSIPTAGPVSADRAGGPRGGPGGMGGPGMGGPGGTPPGGPPPAGQLPGQAQGQAQGQTQGQTQGGGMGGLLDAATPSAELTDLLTEDADSYTWVAAAVGSQSAAGYQLATERSVMPIGGFNGSDPSPTLAQFQALVAAGRAHWFIAGGGPGGGPGGGQDGASTSSQITSWVESTFAATTVDGVTLYDLTAPTTTS